MVYTAYAARAVGQTPWANSCTGVTSSAVGGVTWTPALCQEFDGAAGPPDTTAWSFDLGNNSGWGNEEIETYCGPPGYAGNPSQCPSYFSAQTANSYLDGNGHLVIQVINSGGNWTSARLKTQGTQSFLYGRIEAAVQIPNTSSPGLWPAFWWLGSNYPTVPWPNCGEVDIMENWAPAVLDGPGPAQNRSTIHTALTGGSGITSTYDFPSGQHADTAFHVYGVIWSANLLQFYVNPTTAQVASLKPFFIVTASDLQSGDTWPFNSSAFLLANVAVGGMLGGSTTNTASPQTMTIDYVRQYMPSTVPPPALGQPAGITVTAGATTMGNTTIITPVLAPGTGYVYYSCTTNAPKSTCSISSNDPLNHFVTNAGASTPETLTVTVVTTSNAGALRFFASPQIFGGILPGAASVLLLLAALRYPGTRNVRRGLLCSIAFGSLLVAYLTLVGCDGGNGGGGRVQGSGSSSTIGTTPGNYTVTVFAFTESNMSDGANSNADASVEIPLTVD
jgi:beta-glucanase (GH16 family)